MHFMFDNSGKKIKKRYKIVTKIFLFCLLFYINLYYIYIYITSIKKE